MRVCVSDAGPLTPDKDAGSRATADVIGTLRSLGHDVTFRPVSEIHDLYSFDLFIASRPGPAVHALGVPGFRDVPSIYFGHDLHFARMAEIMDAARVEAFRRLEAMCWGAYDVSIYPAAEEAMYVNAFLGRECALALPIYVMDDDGSRAMEESPDPSCVFVGSAGHAPNRVAVDAIVSEIWPQVASHTRIDLHLVGDWHVGSSPEPHWRLQVHPWLQESALEELVQRSWLSIAPLTFGAGVKRKVVHALSCGTPVVGSRIAFQGLQKQSGSVVGGLVAETPHESAQAVLRLVTDRTLRQELAEEGRSWVVENYSLRASQNAWSHAIEYAQLRFGERRTQPSIIAARDGVKER